MKKIISLLVMSVSLLTLASCNGGGEDVDTAFSYDYANPGKTEIVFSGPASETADYQKFADEFVAMKKKEDANFPYTIRIVNHGEDKVDSEIADWSADASPDVYAFACDKLSTLNNAGALAAVPNDYSKDLTARLTQASNASATINKRLVAYCFTPSNGYFAYVNVAGLKSAGYTKGEWKNWNMEQWITYAEANSLKIVYNLPEGFYGLAAMTSDGADFSVDATSREGKITKVSANFNGELGMKSAKRWYKLIHSSSYGIDQSTAIENAAFIVNGSWGAGSYYGYSDEGKTVINLSNENVATMAIPSFSDGVHPRSFLGTKLFGVNPAKSSDSTTRLRVLHDFASYLVSDDVQLERFQSQNYAPSSNAAAEKEEVKNNPLVSGLAAQSYDGRVQDQVPDGGWSAPKPFFEGLQALTSDADAGIQALLDVFNTTVTTVAA